LTSERYIFVGNRRFVLEQMMDEGVNLVGVVVVAGSHLERDFGNATISLPKGYHTISNKRMLLDLLTTLQFDVLISNGCPYILPISQLPVRKYINVHPSCLPDLRGFDPVIGAILFGRDSGATCHVMDDGVDTGAVISQIRIPYSEDLDVTTLYQLSFQAERMAFSEALAIGFDPQHVQVHRDGLISYRRRAEDWFISFEESNDVILRKIRAFNNPSLGCEFVVNESRYRVYSACRMRNAFLVDFVKSFDEGEVALSFEDCIIFNRDNEVIRFQSIVSVDGAALSVGDRLSRI